MRAVSDDDPIDLAFDATRRCQVTRNRLAERRITHERALLQHREERLLDGGSREAAEVAPRDRQPEADALALIAYFDTLTPPPNPYRNPDGGLSEGARRGEKVFKSEAAGCVRCHPGPTFTDGKTHDVGTSSSGDYYRGYNPPSLVGVHDRPLLLHDGRSRTLEQVLTGPHAPDKVTSRGTLSEAELKDLIEYLKSL